MATQRYVSTSFWNDPWILEECTSDERYVYLYLLTCPSSNIAGIFELSLRTAELHTGYEREQIQRILKRFEEAGKAYYRHRYVIIPKWPTHQRWSERSKIKVGIENILKSLPDAVLATAQEVSYEFPIPTDRVSIGYAYESNYSDTDTDTDTDIDTDTDKEIASSTPAPLSRMKDDVANLWQQSLVAIEPESSWGSFAKERKQLNELAKRTRLLIEQSAFDTPEEVVRAILTEYQRSRKTGKGEYWRNAPVIPSAVMARWPDVVTRIADKFAVDETEVMF